MEIRKIHWENWHQHQSLSPKEFVCGFCDSKPGTNTGYLNTDPEHSPRSQIYICSNCGLPSFFQDGNQYPGPSLGRTINNLPQDVSEVYKEIRETIKDGNFTAALLLGRKLIMHIAVDIAKAKEGETFQMYADHLKSSGYIPPNGEKILEYIKNLGNEKNHEIKIGKKEEAEKILKFIGGLLMFIYEFPGEFEEADSSQAIQSF